MKKFIEFVLENTRYVMAFSANIIALTMSIWWLIDSNFGVDKKLEIEPMVTTMALTATLLGLSFVNNKLTKPHLKVKITKSVAAPPSADVIHGINISIENHSLIKVFIRSFQVAIPKEKKSLYFIKEGFNNSNLKDKIMIEPGENFSFNVIEEYFVHPDKHVKFDPSELGKLIVTTEIGHQFFVPAKVIQEAFSELIKNNTQKT